MGKGILHVWEICPLFKGIDLNQEMTSGQAFGFLSDPG